MIVETINIDKDTAWKILRFILHHDNTPSHAIISVKQFLTGKRITTLKIFHIPDLALYDFFLFSKLMFKSMFKETRFQWMQ